MSDLISREDAIDRIREVYEYEFPTASGAFDEFVTVIIPNLLRNLPSAEPERKTGMWIVDKYKKELTCSVCNETFTEFPTVGWKPLWNYCPNCGAEMRGEHEDA